MKKIFFLLFLLLIPNIVLAKDLVLEELMILNGELSLPFDKMNTEYTVTLDEQEFHLELDYKVGDGITVAVNNNHDLENNSIVTLTITDNESVLEYNFHILKEAEDISPVFNEVEPEEVNSFMFKYKIYIIPSVCLILIILCHKILFRKHKNQII